MMDIEARALIAEKIKDALAAEVGVDAQDG
jgi:hypothetical protein